MRPVIGWGEWYGAHFRVVIDRASVDRSSWFSGVGRDVKVT